VAAWRSRCRRRGLSQVGFNVNDDIHAVADHALVRRDVEIAPIQRDRGLPAGDRSPLHARAKAQRRDFEHDFLRHVLHRENARDGVGIAAGVFPRLALEGHDREFGGGKEIGGAQVVVAHLRIRGDAGYFNDGLDGAVGEVVAIRDDGPFHLAEIAGHLGEKVRDGEADPGMHGVNIVGFDGRLGGRQRAERKAGYDKGEKGIFHIFLM